MSNKKILAILREFQKAPAKSRLRQEYFRLFAKKMAYRTTKTENPEVTMKLVERVFKKLNVKYRA
ncbi:MAG: hypothetical protein HYV34_03255 [Candidatus Kerfeldbacteria bacterium]|nr:hypothetical protein [Candidatus Kerfeldbacteria bacterium]